eukprot:GHVR01160553.1.p2 GENE.GHVR01160553.1~~GHVR01160553.1.p2  ORF type:complete len:151 (-),score=18.17 GHVR01160553.1:1404-1856(-)
MRFFLGADYLNPNKIVEALENTVLNSGDGAYGEDSALAIEDGVAAHAGIQVTGQNKAKSYNRHKANRSDQGEGQGQQRGCVKCGRSIAHDQGFRCPALDSRKRHSCMQHPQLMLDLTQLTQELRGTSLGQVSLHTLQTHSTYAKEESGWF